MDHVAVRHGGAALAADAELLAHEAGAAVAAGEEVAADGFGRAGFHGAQGDGDARLVLLEILEGRAPARVDQRVVHYRVAQHRLDHDLADAHGGLAWLRAVVAGADLGALLDHAGIAEAVQLAAALLARQRGDPGDVEVVLFRHGDGAELVGDAQAAEQLHRAAVGDVHLGMPRGRRIALDQQAAYAERGERAGKRHAHRPAARDQDGDVNHVPPRLSASEALSARVSGGEGGDPRGARGGRGGSLTSPHIRPSPSYSTPPHLPIASQWGPSSPRFAAERTSERDGASRASPLRRRSKGCRVTPASPRLPSRPSSA